MPVLVPVNADNPEPRKIRRAVEVLEAGGVITYPTDTSYALACDLGSKTAIDRLYQAKGMPRTQPLAFIFADLSHIAQYAVVEKHHYRVLRHYLPGPYCFILSATREVPKVVPTDGDAVVRTMVQQSDPPGVGARDVRECLLLQLRQHPVTPTRDLALRIVADHLEPCRKPTWPCSHVASARLLPRSTRHCA